MTFLCSAAEVHFTDYSKIVPATLRVWIGLEILGLGGEIGRGIDEEEHEKEKRVQGRDERELEI